MGIQVSSIYVIQTLLIPTMQLEYSSLPLNPDCCSKEHLVCQPYPCINFPQRLPSNEDLAPLSLHTTQHLKNYTWSLTVY